MKSRLVRFLREKLGFNLLAWECGFFDIETFNAEFKGSTPLVEAASKNLSYNWSRSLQVLPLFAYSRETQLTGNPIVNTGFDFRIVTKAAREIFPQKLFDFLSCIDSFHVSQELMDRVRDGINLSSFNAMDRDKIEKYN
jgi:erythromycin esterase